MSFADSRQDSAIAVRIIGRSSSLFTRMPLIFAEELGIRYQLDPIPDMTAIDPRVYGGSPALKLPILRRGQSLLFGAQNICRALAEMSTTSLRVVWPEELCDDLTRNAQELVWHAMGAQVQLVFGTLIGKLPPDNIYFAKGRAGFEGSLLWLERQAAEILATLPPRDLSLFEVSLFCLIEHLSFRPTVSIESYPTLIDFSKRFAARPSAQRTAYRFDAPAAG
jgi:glutathione S-transferase